MRTSLKLFLFLGLMAVATPSFAQVHLGINFGPPARRTEVRGRAPSRTSVWIGGYYTYNASRSDYDWNQGRWQERPSAHSTWDAPRYKANNDHYDYYEGKWNDHGRDNKGQGNQGRGNQGRGNQGNDQQGKDQQGRGH